jgi:hypothetical protein
VVDDAAERAAAEMLALFESASSLEAWSRHITWCKEHWASVRDVRDMTKRFVTARDAAKKRLGGVAT